MAASPSSLLELAADCDANRIRLIPGRDGSLTIDAPRGILTPELLGRLKTHKAAILVLLLRAEDFDADSARDADLAPFIEPGTNLRAVCRCGSTAWRDAPIHDGQSVRRDCSRCGRFIKFTNWYGTDTLHNEQ